MSSAIRQILLFFIVVLVVKCSQSFSVSYPVDEDLDEDAQQMRPTRFATPRGGKRSEPYPEIDEFDIYNPDAVNLPRFSSLEQRSERFAAPRGKRGPEGWPTNGYKFRAPRPGKRTYVVDSMPGDGINEDGTNNMKRVSLRSGSRFYRNNGVSGFLRIGRSGFLRIGRAVPGGFLRIGKSEPKRSQFLRIGRTPMDFDAEEHRSRPKSQVAEESGFLRIGRLVRPKSQLPDDMDDEDQDLIRELRGRPKRLDMNYLRVGRSRPKRMETESFLRIGRSSPEFSLSQEDLIFLLNHRQDVLNLLQNSNTTSTEDLLDGYFVFPRQGRAMSFYFPRMGRSGDDVTDESECCTEGVRNVFAMNRGGFEICPRAKSCCDGLQEKAKLYNNVVITECTRDTSLDKIRQLINKQ